LDCLDDLNPFEAFPMVTNASRRVTTARHDQHKELRFMRSTEAGDRVQHGKHAQQAQADWYYVKLPDGDVKRASIDELDAWFEAGLIDAKTMVLAGDATRWTRLGQLAGLEEEAPPVRRAPPAYVPPPLASHRPVSIDLSESPLDADNPFGSTRRRSGRSKTGWGLALGGLVLTGIMGSFVAYRQPAWAQAYVSRIKQATGLQASGAAPAIPVFPAAVEAPTSPAPQPPATPVWQSAPAGAPGGLGSVPQPVDRAGVDSTRRSAGLERTHGPKAKTNRSTGAASRTHVPPRKSAQPFTTTGNKFDPLNSSI
jgi:hypothetical protein